MADEGPRLRVVGDDERAAPLPSPEEPDRGSWWRSPAVGVIAAAVLLLGGLGFGIWFLFRGDGDPSSATTDVGISNDVGPPQGTAASSTSTSPAVTATAPPTTAVPQAAAPGPDTPTLVPVPLAGQPGAATPSTAPPRGSVTIRLFNGFTDGQDLEVWEVSDRPVRYGTLPYGGFAAIDAHGTLAPGGVDLHLRFVRPGGDPMATPDPVRGPWTWNLTPTADSSQTLVLVRDGNLHITRIDNRRAASAVRWPYVHVVPIVRQLEILGDRNLRWGLVGGGCLGPSSGDNTELDVAAGAQLQLARAGDAQCGSPVAGPATMPPSSAVAVIALPPAGGHSPLVVLPLN
jgi:hypothetical protein